MFIDNKKCLIYESGCLLIIIYNFIFFFYLYVYFDWWCYILSDVYICIIDFFFVRGFWGRYYKDFYWGGLDGIGEVECLW